MEYYKLKVCFVLLFSGYITVMCRIVFILFDNSNSKGTVTYVWQSSKENGESPSIPIYVFKNVPGDHTNVIKYQRFKNQDKELTKKTQQGEDILGVRGDLHNNISAAHDINSSSGWLTVDHLRTVFIFSAYFDNRSMPIIRIIGISLNNRTQPDIKCYIRGSGKKDYSAILYERNGYIRPLPEDKGRKYLGVFVICNLKPDDRPSHVSVQLKTATSSTKGYLRVVYPSPLKKEFHVCFPAINSAYMNSHEMIQTVEMARIFGADGFNIYDNGHSLNINKVLNLYRSEKVLEIIDWTLPVSDIHYFGQIVAVNDCLYRNMGRTKYLLFMDLDEMLVPRQQHRTWSDMMHVLDKTNYDNATFYFQSCFFQKSWKDVYDGLESETGYNETMLIQKYKIQLLSKLWREKKLQRIRYRSKFIVRPEKVETLAIHVVYKFLERPKFTYVHPKIAFLHHYRLWKPTKERVQDTSTRRFTKPLIKRVSAIWKQLNTNQEIK